MSFDTWSLLSNLKAVFSDIHSSSSFDLYTQDAAVKHIAEVNFNTIQMMQMMTPSVLLSYIQQEPVLPHDSCQTKQELSKIFPMSMGPGTVPIANGEY